MSKTKDEYYKINNSLCPQCSDQIKNYVSELEEQNKKMIEILIALIIEMDYYSYMYLETKEIIEMVTEKKIEEAIKDYEEIEGDDLYFEESDLEYKDLLGY